MNRPQLWIAGWVGLASSLVTIFTLGFVLPSWEMDWCLACVAMEKGEDDAE